MNIEDELRKAAEATETAENNQHHAELMSETMMRAKAQDRLAVTDAAMTQLELKRLRARDAANRAFKRELEGPPRRVLCSGRDQDGGVGGSSSDQDGTDHNGCAVRPVFQRGRQRAGDPDQPG